MGIGIATIAAFLLLLPGVGFIVGVNIADKNVREIVFRNTPAELGYVIFVSLVVHLIFALVTTALALIGAALLPQNPYWLLFGAVDCLRKFNAAFIYLRANSASDIPLDHARNVTIFALLYFLLASIVGFWPGFKLGRWVQAQTWPWTSFFIKHRWMLALVQSKEARTVTARVVLKDKLSRDGGKERPVVITGVLRDSYFGSDGKLLYLVFRSFSLHNTDGSKAHSLRGFGAITEVTADTIAPVDHLFIEGDRIAFVRYTQRSFPVDAIENLEDD